MVPRAAPARQKRIERGIGMSEVKGKVVAITGASSGIGEAAARLLAAEGAKVVLGARRTDRLAAIAAEIRKAGGEAEAKALDVTRRDDLAAFVKAAQDRFGRLDVLVNNAGGSPNAEAATASPRFSEAIIRLNLLAPLNLAQAANAIMQAQDDGGSIINIGSLSGDRGRGSNHAYGAAKAGLTAFCSGLRARMAARGVHVLTVKPGFIDSPMTAHITKKGALWATPERIAEGTLNAIDRRRNVVYLPGFWALIMLVIKHVPERVFKRLKF